MALGSRTVAQRDVNFNVNLGVFRAELGEAGRIYAQTTGQMSTESLRLSVAEEKVARAIKLHGAQSIQARNATVALRREMSLLNVSAREQETAILSDERAMGRFSRGAIAAAGASSELKRALLLGSGSFLLGVGIAGLLRASLDAAKNEEAALSQLQVALKNTGQSWNVYGARVDNALQAQVRATGFTKEELTQALTQNVRRFGNLNEALKANLLAADVARQKNISLADAQTLVQRASLGQSRSLLTLGINFTKTTSNVDALRASTSKASKEQLANAKAADAQANRTAALQAIFAKFHGSAAKFLQTSAGKQALFNAELKDSEEIIGGALLPTVNHYLDRLSSWLDKMNKSGKLQRDVNGFMRGAGHAAHEAETGFKAIEDILGPFNRLLGGTRHTIDLITIALLAYKTRGVTAFVTGTKQVEAAAAAEGAALTTLAGEETAATAGAGGVVGGAAARRGGSSIVSRIAGGAAGLAGGLTPGLLVYGFAQALTAPKETTLATGSRNGAKTRVIARGGKVVYEIFGGPGTGTHTLTVKDLQALLDSGEVQLTDAGKRLLGLEKKPGFADGADRSNHPGIQGAPAATTGTGSAGRTKPKAPVIGLTERQQTALLIAEGTKSTADDLAALRGQLSILQRLLKQKGLTPADLNALLQQRNSVQDQIDSILASGTTQAKKRADKAASAAKKAREARKKAERERAKAYLELIRHDESGLKTAVEKAKLTSSTADDIAALRKLEAFYKKEANDPKLSRALRDTFKAKDAAERVAIQKAAKTATQNQGADIREFLSEFRNVISSYSSNLGLQRPSVTVNQHFQAPTVDRHREARLARFAVGAAFD